MFGRESSFIDLLKLIQFDSVEEEIISEDEVSEAEEGDDLTELDVSNFDDKRKVSQGIARESVLREQAIQKRIFDAKVHQKRYIYDYNILPDLLASAMPSTDTSCPYSGLWPSVGKQLSWKFEI